MRKDNNMGAEYDTWYELLRGTNVFHQIVFKMRLYKNKKECVGLFNLNRDNFNIEDQYHPAEKWDFKKTKITDLPSFYAKFDEQLKSVFNQIFNVESE